MLVRKYRFRMRFVNPEANIFNRFFTIFRVLTFLTRISHKRNPSAFTFIFTQVPVVYFEVLSVIRNVTENISAKMTCSICVCCDDYLMYGNFSGPNSGLPLLILNMQTSMLLNIIVKLNTRFVENNSPIPHS